MNNKTDCKGQAVEPAKVIVRRWVSVGNLPRSVTRLKLSQGNLATAPARDFQGFLSVFQANEGFWGGFPSEVARRNYLIVSF